MVDVQSTSAQQTEDAAAPETSPPYANSFGYTLAIRVMQSGLYLQLHGVARDECDELVRRGQTHGVGGLGDAQR